MNSTSPRPAPSRPRPSPPGPLRPAPSRPARERPAPTRHAPPHISAPLFTNTVYDLVAAILAFCRTVRANPHRTWDERDKTINGLNRVLQELLALTARMNPFKIGQAFFAAQRLNAALASTPNEAPQPTPQPEPEPEPEPHQKTRRAPPRPAHLLPYLSARQTAHRFAALLRDLQQIANDAFQPLPDEIKELAEKVRTMAGAPTLPIRPTYYNPKPNRRRDTPASWRTVKTIANP